jgi:predicted Rossmann fold nucleotide-binding protein DprA/Smf involved in DNA uptake
VSERVRLSEEQRLNWLPLIRTENIGPRTFRDLWRRARHWLPCPRSLAAAPARICSREDAEAELRAARSRGVEFVALGEPDYPSRLQMIDDAPPLLAVRGKLAVLTRPLVAIVGSRNASAAGVKFAERLARDLGAAGFGTVSGLARGIDAAAHRASLSTGTISGPERRAASKITTPTGEDERARITGLLGPTPVLIDDLVRLSRTSPAIVRTVLLELEIAGRLERHDGGLVSLL